MNPLLQVHNQHLDSIKQFEKNDPQLMRLKKLAFQYENNILQELPFQKPGIYSIGGGRQIGKSTILKQWMLKLLKRDIPADAVYYTTGEVIDDHHNLIRTITQILKDMPNRIKYILIDEVTYIKGWDKAVKFLADAALLDKVVLMVTGSELTFIQEARMRFPGRRGKSDTVDFHLYPLSFREFINLTTKIDLKDIDRNSLSEKNHELLQQKFKEYLIHGGYLTAINDYAKNKKLSISTLSIYSDWIRGDVLKRGKQEQYLQEIISSIFKNYGSQVTWNSLARSLSIDHPATVADYLLLLEAMDAIFIQYALLEDKLIAAPKKARKVMFCDPFIYHAAWHWLTGELPTPEMTPILESKLVEAVCITHFRRWFPTYYIKAEGEVDIAYVDKNTFHPIELKWTEQLRPKDLKQIAKYKNGCIWGKQVKAGSINNIKYFNLPLNLAKL